MVIDTEDREFLIHPGERLALPMMGATRALDELFGQSKPAATARGKRGPSRQWRRHIEAVA